MLARMWSKRNTPPLLVGEQTCIITLEINLVVSKKTVLSSTSKLSYTTPGHVPKRASTIPNYLHKALVIIARNWKQLRCPSTEE